MSSAPARLRSLLARPGCHLMPCCFDPLSARLVEASGFPVTFASGFCVAAAHGLPDTGLLSYGEMEHAMRRITGSLKAVPCIGDGDTGYGNAVNAKRTVAGYARAGLAGIMIEDQVAPKRCGHTQGKAVVDRAAATARVRAAVDAARETAGSADDAIVVMARTDAAATHGLDEALYRAQAFRDAGAARSGRDLAGTNREKVRIPARESARGLCAVRLSPGADILFVEAPRSVEELRRVCSEASGVPHMANLLQGGLTPVLSQSELAELGFKLAAYPLDLLNATIAAQRRTLEALKATGQPSPGDTLPFGELTAFVGFDEYNAEAERYSTGE